MIIDISKGGEGSLRMTCSSVRARGGAWIAFEMYRVCWVPTDIFKFLKIALD